MLIRRAMECLNVIVMFEMLFMFYHLEQKCLHSVYIAEMSGNTPDTPEQFMRFHYHINFRISASLTTIT